MKTANLNEVGEFGVAIHH